MGTESGTCNCTRESLSVTRSPMSQVLAFTVWLRMPTLDWAGLEGRPYTTSTPNIAARL